MAGARTCARRAHEASRRELRLQAQQHAGSTRASASGTVFAAVLVAWWLARGRGRRWVNRKVRYAGGRLAGVRYRLVVGHPPGDVGDDVLTDRVRSVLGQVTKRLDVPHVHVTVSRHVVLLHGQVGTYDDAEAIEQAAHDVDGVDGVLSYLHVGLEPGATRPSEGAAVYVPSAAFNRLVEAAKAAGVQPPVAVAAVRAVLATFIGRLPADARDHLFAHLPRDVQVLTRPPRRRGSITKLRRFDDFISAVLATDHVDPAHAADVTRAVLSALRDLVPEEVVHVAAVLPNELRPLWPLPAPA